MKSKIIEKTDKKIVLQVEIALNSDSMLKSEEEIQSALNEANTQATQIALEQFDTDGSAIFVNGEKLTSKGKEKKLSIALWSNSCVSSCLSE